MSSDRARAHSLHPVTSLTVSCAWGGRLLALIGKEGRQILRDPSSWLVAFVLPCLFLLFFGYAVSLDADNLRLAVIDESGGAKAHGLGLSFAQSPHFRLVPAASRQEAARMMGMDEDRIQVFSDYQQVLDRMAGALEKHDVVLVKGSRFVELDRFVEGVC